MVKRPLATSAAPTSLPQGCLQSAPCHCYINVPTSTTARRRASLPGRGQCYT